MTSRFHAIVFARLFDKPDEATPWPAHAHKIRGFPEIDDLAAWRERTVAWVRLRGMVQEGVTAEVFRPEDADHLAEVAERLVLDPERRTALGAAARAWVSENRTWPQLASRYLDVYRGLGALG